MNNKQFEVLKEMHFKKCKANESFIKFLEDLFKRNKYKDGIQVELDLFGFKDVDIDLELIEKLAQSIIGECKVYTWIDSFTGRKILQVRKKKERIVDKIVLPIKRCEIG